MDQTGMWKLFFATGLPEAYLAARSQEADEVSVPPSERPLCSMAPERFGHGDMR